MALQLRYYQSDEGGDNYPDTDNVPSGAYIFKPAKDIQYSMPFINVSGHENCNSPFVQQTTLYYTDSISNRTARVIVRAFAKSQTVEFEVYIGPLPESMGGQEVTVNFFFYNLDTNNTFYTDSNGLEM